MTSLMVLKPEYMYKVAVGSLSSMTSLMVLKILSPMLCLEMRENHYRFQ